MVARACKKLNFLDVTVWKHSQYSDKDTNAAEPVLNEHFNDTAAGWSWSRLNM